MTNVVKRIAGVWVEGIGVEGSGVEGIGVEVVGIGTVLSLPQATAIKRHVTTRQTRFMGLLEALHLLKTVRAAGSAQPGHTRK
jgi:hypothetical protein